MPRPIRSPSPHLGRGREGDGDEGGEPSGPPGGIVQLAEGRGRGLGDGGLQLRGAEVADQDGDLRRDQQRDGHPHHDQPQDLGQVQPCIARGG